MSIMSIMPMSRNYFILYQHLCSAFFLLVLVSPSLTVASAFTNTNTNTNIRTTMPPQRTGITNAITSTSISNSKSICSTSQLSEEPASIESLIDGAKSLYRDTFDPDETSNDELICAIAPGRVNLIGEHTDYTQGFVFPMAIGFSTVCIGKGTLLLDDDDDDDDESDGSKGLCQITSVNANANANTKSPNVISFTASQQMPMTPLPSTHPDAWSNYVAGVVNEYMPLLPSRTSLSLQLAIHGNVPLGSGLSSSAALEVAVATFLERMIRDKFPKLDPDLDLGGEKEKALRCQRAENLFCGSPCGIMDQYVSAAAERGSAILIDCKSLEYESVHMGSESGSELDQYQSDDQSKSSPVFLICNSNVKHSIGGGEYPVRVQQCKEATEILRSVCGDRIESLRDATLDDVELAHKKGQDGGGEVQGEEPLMNDLIYKRAKHVITENARTLQAKTALQNGDWKQFGTLMNESHESMKTDYQVSCPEIDFLADLAQKFDGVYGSRLTGGGFGGCTVTLVERERAGDLVECLRKEYREKWIGCECTCFVTSPGPGARSYVI
jgi:galactokinase